MYLDVLSTERDVFVIDIEADSLTPTVIWCMCWINIKTKQTGTCFSASEGIAFFENNKAAIFVGHNILKYDGPVLNRLWGTRLSLRNMIDSLVLSTLYSPSISGGHSLGAWGERLGKAKGEFHDFAGGLSPEMLEYCHQDVAITCELFQRLIKTLVRIGFSEKSIDIQHRFTVIIDRQQRNGFYFDGHRAIELYQGLRTRQEELEELIHHAFPPELQELAHYKRAFKADGTESAGLIGHRSTYESVEILDDGTYKVFGRVPFNIGSPKQRVEKLEALGWVAREFTEKGGATPFIKGKLAPSLEEFLETHNVPEVELIAKYMSVQGRANMINTWLDNWNEDDSCIHGRLFVADTLRLRHQAPNTANIPAVRVRKDANGIKHVLYGEEGYFTYESRDLWCARPHRVLVGTDAAGLELRMLANYLKRDEFTKQVVEGDPHQSNADLVDISRETAKTLIYAVSYGASGGKVAKTLNVPYKEGCEIRQRFLDRLGLTELLRDINSEFQQGRIQLCDGAMVICPSSHAALNYKLQGGGARVMAQASIFLEKYIKQDGLDSLAVGNIHDEVQYDVEPTDANQHAKRAVQAIQEAGEELNLSVPMDGVSKIGKTWSETH